MTERTWDDALQVHKNRVRWCANFSEALLALERNGAPLPDAVAAGHADWVTREGVVRIGMTLGGGLALMPYRMRCLPNPPGMAGKLVDVPKNAEPSQIAEVCQIWAQYLAATYAGGATELPTAEPPVPADSSEHLLEVRGHPYFDPSKTKK